MSGTEDAGSCRNLTPQPHFSDSDSASDAVSHSASPYGRRTSRYRRPDVAPTCRMRRLDANLLTTLEYRLVDREILQLRNYTPGGRGPAQRDLAKMWQAGYLDKLRRRPVIARDVYVISGRAPKGLRRLYELLGEEAVKRRLKRPRTVDHSLAVNHFRVAVEVAARDHGFRVERWQDELDLAHLVREGVVPDAFFRVVRDEGGREHRAGFFVESELALLSRAHWAKRLAKYDAYYYSGKYEASFGLRSLRLLVITSSARQLSAVVEEAERVGFAPLHAATWDQMRSVPPADVLSGAIWARPSETDLASLYPTPNTKEG